MLAFDRDIEAPGSVDELRDRVLAVNDALPRRLRQVANYVLANPERIAVSTVAELAEGAGVQPSAFVRFCQALGYSGFSEMQKLYRGAYTQRWPDYATRLDRLRDRGGSPAQLVGDFVEAGHKSLSLLSETLDLAALDRSAAVLSEAATIHIVGLKRSLPAASYLAYIFEKMRVPAMLHSSVGGVVHRHALRAGDAVIAITFLPYTQETVELAQHAADRGIAVIGITDTVESPIRDVSREVLSVSEVDVGAFRSLAATMALCAALAVAVGAAKKHA